MTKGDWLALGISLIVVGIGLIIFGFKSKVRNTSIWLMSDRGGRRKNDWKSW